MLMSSGGRADRSGKCGLALPSAPPWRRGYLLRMASAMKLQMIGGGKMAEALLGGLIRDGWAAVDAIHVVEPADERRVVLTGVHPGLSVGDAPIDGVDAVIAVKPNIVDAVLPGLRAAGVKRVLSIAAGITTAAIEAGLPAGTAVVRCMPRAAVRRSPRPSISR